MSVKTFLNNFGNFQTKCEECGHEVKRVYQKGKCIDCLYPDMQEGKKLIDENR